MRWKLKRVLILFSHVSDILIILDQNNIESSSKILATDFNLSDDDDDIFGKTSEITTKQSEAKLNDIFGDDSDDGGTDLSAKSG